MIPLPIPLLAKIWPYIAIICLAGALYLSVRHNGALSAQLDNAIEVANQNAAIADEERAARKRSDSIIAAYEAKGKERKQHTNQKLAEISHATPDMDGPLARVLRGVLDELPAPDKPTGKNDS